MKYKIIVGEVENEIGHVTTVDCEAEQNAIRKAKALVKPYGGDGWYLVTDETGQAIARGGRKHL